MAQPWVPLDLRCKLEREMCVKLALNQTEASERRVRRADLHGPQTGQPGVACVAAELPDDRKATAWEKADEAKGTAVRLL